jgi:hypothetical protein
MARQVVFVRPALTASLALLWIGSGLAGLVNPPADEGRVAIAIGVPANLILLLGVMFSILDLAIGGCLASGRAGRRIAIIQFVLVAGYTVGIGLCAPWLWLDPFGSLLKNLPILAAILAWAAMLEDR